LVSLAMCGTMMRERLRDGVGVRELEESLASVGEQEDGDDQHEDEEDAEDQDEDEERRDALARFFRAFAVGGLRAWHRRLVQTSCGGVAGA
jgi:hypothetical protein